MTGAKAADAILPLVFDDVGLRVGDRWLLRDLSFQLEPGARTIVLGPNGAGKSLMLRLAHGLIEPTTGRIRWQGSAAGGSRSAIARHQAMAFERAILLRRSTYANVDFALSLRGVPRNQRRPRVEAVLEKTGLSALADAPARVLSSGEQQRLVLARAWVLQPEVLFLDEPTAALDPSATRAVEALIERIAADGCKVVMTTHDLGQARRLADEVLFLHSGRLLERTAAGRFFDGPETPEAKAFLKGELFW